MNNMNTTYILYLEIDKEHIHPDRVEATQKTYQTFINMWKQNQVKQWSNGHNYDAGFDLPLLKSVQIESSYESRETIHLGVRAKMIRQELDARGTITKHPVCYYLYPRSSISKTPFRMANSVGIIDSGYRGPLKAVVDVQYSGGDYPFVAEGTRLFQICAPNLGRIDHVEIVKSLEDTVRGDGGFGSTGTRVENAFDT